MRALVGLLLAICLVVCSPLLLYGESKIPFISSDYSYDGFDDLKVSETLSFVRDTESNDYWLIRPIYLFHISQIEPGSWLSGQPTFPKVPEFELKVNSVSHNGAPVTFRINEVEALDRVVVENKEKHLPPGNHVFQLDYILKNYIQRKNSIIEFDAYSSGRWQTITDHSLIVLRFPSWIKKAKLLVEPRIISYKYFSTSPTKQVQQSVSTDSASNQEVYKFDLNEPLDASQGLMLKVKIDREIW